ncbi:recombinase family protein [Oscillospiraceae bacterium OttesenSCG-928-G22]|nr:recombinase family protein [Oscillospiraceae bacterium OttesenSCG-928-G22]
MQTKQNNYSAAIYCRLSSDDGQAGESGSIATQRALITRYCEENGFPIHDCYCDDGWSGTSFERPEFKRMIDDIEEGKVNLVVVKDLSRFGREHVMAGYWIERFFPEKDVRFIAIGDHIDSNDGLDNLMLPFTNVINSFYAQEASRKTKAAHRTRAKDGKYLGGHAVFGYVKDPDDRHHLVIDPEAAEVVREIFRMFSEGIGYVRMTKILRERRILNPQAYFNQNNPDYYQSDYWRKPFDWHATSIRVILKNEVYLGRTVFGKTKSKGVFNKKRIAAPREEWIVVENTHEPIVSRETWDIVQKLMESRRRESGKGEIQMFAGLVKCAGCGSALNVSFDAKKQKYKNFSCWVYKNYGKERCTSHAIGWKTMCELVLEDIRRNAQAAELLGDEYISRLIRLRTDKQRRETEGYKRELKAADKRIGQLDATIAKLFEQSALEKISDERFRALLETYEADQSVLKARREDLTAAIGQAEEAYSNVENFASLIRRHTDIRELNAHILSSLIDRIVVHEKETHEDVGKSQRVDIHYKFIGFLPMEQWLMDAETVNGIPTAELLKDIRQESA